jgi:hypothetical protein
MYTSRKTVGMIYRPYHYYGRTNDLVRLMIYYTVKIMYYRMGNVFQRPIWRLLLVVVSKRLGSTQIPYPEHRLPCPNIQRFLKDVNSLALTRMWFYRSKSWGISDIWTSLKNFGLDFCLELMNWIDLCFTAQETFWSQFVLGPGDHGLNDHF